VNVAETGVDDSFCQNFFVKKNASLRINNNSASLLWVGTINITPYLYYTMKDTTIKVGESYKNTHLIDNRDDAQDITYSIIAGNEKGVATIDAEGNVSATRACELTIQAKWGTFDVTTTYQLSIVAEKTTITLYRNDGTEDADEIVNNYGEAMPQFTLPTLAGYRFNAYWTKPDTSKASGSNRFTVTTADSATVWVAKRYIKPDSIVDYKRRWAYEGTTYTFYADWRPERTITLDNQEATESGTDKVVTAYCPNNNLLRLTESISVPAKTNYTFKGYYTEANGQGSQLIDATGAFKASVAGYTDKDKWFIKDADITVYAYWEVASEITLDENKDNSSLIEAADDKENVTVHLVRTLAADKYNSFCVPFDITKTALATALNTEITSLATLDENSTAKLDAEKKNLNIMIKEVEAIEAGKPYLLWIAEEKVNPTFPDVTISKASETISSSDGNVVFHGITSPFAVAKNDKTILFVSNNKLNWNNAANASIKGLRAYFKVPGMEGQDPTQVSARLVMNKHQVSTGMDNVNVNANANRKMIINNQLIIIRDGKMFNAQGALIK